MTKSKEENIWTDAVTLRSEDLAETKVHVTLRIDPNLYRKILAEQKRSKDRTVTATVERILRSKLEESGVEAYVKILGTLRNVLAHSALQDEIISKLAPAKASKSNINIEKLLTERRKLSAESDSLEKLIESFHEGQLRATA